MSDQQSSTLRIISCRESESILIGNGIEVTVVEVDGDDVVFRIDGLDEMDGEGSDDAELLATA